MLYNQITELLNDGEFYIEDLIIIKTKLMEVDSKCAELEFYELQMLWEIFSATRCASFLETDDRTLDDFLIWIQDPM